MNVWKLIEISQEVDLSSPIWRKTYGNVIKNRAGTFKVVNYYNRLNGENIVKWEPISLSRCNGEKPLQCIITYLRRIYEIYFKRIVRRKS